MNRSALPDETVMYRALLNRDRRFAGLRERFELPLLTPGTAFQRKAWAALLAAIAHRFGDSVVFQPDLGRDGGSGAAARERG